MTRSVTKHVTFPTHPCCPFLAVPSLTSVQPIHASTVFCLWRSRCFFTWLSFIELCKALKVLLLSSNTALIDYQSLLALLRFVPAVRGSSQCSTVPGHDHEPRPAVDGYTAPLHPFSRPGRPVYPLPLHLHRWLRQAWMEGIHVHKHHIFTSVQYLDNLGRRGWGWGHEGRFSIGPLPVSAGGHRTQFWHRQGRPLSHVVHPVFPLPTMA